MLLRVRSKNGTWRLSDVSPTTTINEIKDRIHTEYGIEVSIQTLTLDQKSSQPLLNTSTLSQYNIKHGDMIYLDYTGEFATSSKVIGRKVNPDGTLIHITYQDRATKNAFRPGLKSLRDMKMHWTLDEFMRMDAQFEYKISPQKEPYSTKVLLDSASCNDFQSYLRQFAFQQSRCGWLFGTENKETKEITVDFIYEPPQEGNPYGFEVLDDPLGDRVDDLAAALGKEKVGWVFSHPPREDDAFHFSSREILLAAQLQLDAGGKGSTFVTLKVTLDKQGHASFEAFQVSDQCMEMYAAGALLENEDDPKTCLIHETFTAIVEAKAAPSVDNNFFLCVVPVGSYDSPLKCEFPKVNRQGQERTRNALKKQLQKYAALPYIKRIADFQLLLFLTDFLDPTADLHSICQAIRDPNIELNSGYPLLIDSVAGNP